jgi:L-asparagine oxygenase
MRPALDPQFVFTDEERETFIREFSDIRVNPYSDYVAFRKGVKSYATTLPADSRFAEFISMVCARDAYEYPHVTMANCPIDSELPRLDFENPVEDKRARKRTYVSETFLALYATVTSQHPIGYTRANNGDVFHDVKAKKSLVDNAGQKGLYDLYFHKDAVTHYVSPDWVNLVGLRSSSANQVYTSCTRNKDIIDNLDDATIDILSSCMFYTPFEDVAGAFVDLGGLEKHEVIGGNVDHEIRIFENRTVGLTVEAQTALYQLIKVAHRNKVRYEIKPGFFLGVANNESIHCKEVIEVNDLDGLEQRWLQKTFNVKEPSAHQQYLAEGSDYLVVG